MQYEKPLIFIYPISDTLLNLKKAIESSGQPLDIYEIDDLRELLQTIPALGQALVLGSNAKKCAKFLQAGKKIVKTYDSKVIIVSQKEYPRKTVDKLMKFGLNDIIFEPVPAKTLMYKINLALRSLKVPSKKEMEKKFKAEQAKKEEEQEQSFSNKDENPNPENGEDNGNDNGKNNGDDNGNEINNSKQNQEENEEELIASMSNPSIKKPHEEEDNQDYNNLDVGNSEYEEKMAALAADSEESEEELLNSLQGQTIKTKSEDNDDFGPVDATSPLNSAYEDSLASLEAADDEVSEEDLLADLNSQKIKPTHEMDEGFDPNSMDTGKSDQDIESAYDPFDDNSNDDEEETISLADLSKSKNTEEATNLEGENENYDTHMEGKGNTEHIEDDEHQLSEEDMEYAEMEALAEISKLETKMRGEGSESEKQQDHMEGALSSNDEITDHMEGDDNYNELEDSNLQGEVGDTDQLNSLMEGDINLSELSEDGQLEGDVNQEFEEGGDLEGDLLASLEEQGNLEGQRLTKERNIQTHYDSEAGINHQDTYDPLEHAANNDQIDGSLKGDVYESEDYGEDDLAALMDSDVDLNDLTGDTNGLEDDVGGNLEGDLLMDLAENDGQFEGVISEEDQAGNLNGHGSTDHLMENDLDGANNSIMGDKGEMKGHTAEGTEHIETHYNTDFASKLDKKKKLNPMMEFETEDDFYGQAHLPKGKGKDLNGEFEEDLYGEFGHTNSLNKDKENRAIDQFAEFDGELKADTDFRDHKAKKPEMPYEMEYDENGAPKPNQKMQELEGDIGNNGLNKNQNPKMQYDLDTDWSKRDPKLKPKYSMEEFEDNRKQEKFEKPQISIDEQYQIYEEMDLDNLIDDFGADDEFGEEHLDELKEMANDLKSHFYDDYEPAKVTKLENFDDKIVENEEFPIKTAEEIDPEAAMGLDTLIAISQVYQTVTLRPNDAIYQVAKLIYSEQNALTCFLQFDGKKISEIYNSITDAIVSDNYLEQQEWDILKTKLLQKIKSTSASFWEGPDDPGTPKIYATPCYDGTNQFGAIIAYFPNNIELTRRSFIQTLCQSLNRISYSALPMTHTIKQAKEDSINGVEKEGVLDKAKGFLKENFIEEEVDETTGTKGSRFGNWLKKKIDKLAS